LIRNFGNKLGLAWWAKIETDQPSGTYWFGPFITKRSLKENFLLLLMIFLMKALKILNILWFAAKKKSH